MSFHGAEAVIFDMDGLLVDSERLARDALIETARRFEKQVDYDLFKQMIGVPEDASHELLIRRYGSDFPAAQFLEQATLRCRALVNAGHLDLKPGAVELLQSLELAGIPKAVATSSSRAKAEHTLRAVGVLSRFNAVVCRDDVARGKPYPDLFLSAASRLEVDPAVCIVLEDSHNGIRAAHAAGMKVIMVPDLLSPTPSDIATCEIVVPNLFAVLSILSSQGVLETTDACRVRQDVRPTAT
jgi:HAD superfamily hydrolase (TIGR01509 family)